MKKKSILDFLNSDISDFFSKSYKEINSEDSLAIMSIDYELLLDTKEFDIFNCMRLRVMFDKLSIESEQHINVNFIHGKKAPSIQKSNAFIYTLYKIMGKDIHHQLLKNNSLIPTKFSTSWHSNIGDSFIQVIRDEDLQISFSILFVNNILKEYNKKIVF